MEILLMLLVAAFPEVFLLLAAVAFAIVGVGALVVVLGGGAILLISLFCTGVMTLIGKLRQKISDWKTGRSVRIMGQ